MQTKTSSRLGGGDDLKQAKRRADLRRSLHEACLLLASAIDDLEDEYDVLLEGERVALDLLYSTANEYAEVSHLS